MSTQKVLGLNLAATSLPDAIAAMVEAWYEAQNVEDDIKKYGQNSETFDISYHTDCLIAHIMTRPYRLIEYIKNYKKGNRVSWEIMINNGFAYYKTGRFNSGEEEIAIMANSEMITATGEPALAGALIMSIPGSYIFRMESRKNIYETWMLIKGKHVWECYERARANLPDLPFPP
jgi:hypothetical protein